MNESTEAIPGADTPDAGEAPAAEEETPTFRRLPGRGRALSASLVSSDRQRLYLAPDFLLAIRANYAEETHKKFYFEDIQAITVQTNSERAIFGAVLFVITIGILLIGVYLETVQEDTSGDMIILFSMLAAFPGILLLVNLLRGPTCAVRLHTAVQIHELSCLRRTRVARKCLNLIVPEIRAAQAGWPEEMSTPEAIAAQPFRASVNAPELKMPSKRKAIGIGVHAFAFWVTVVFGLSALGDIVYMHGAKNIFDSALMVAASIALIVAIVRQAESTIPKNAKYLVWATLVLNGSALMISSFFGTMLQVMAQDPGTVANPFSMQQFYFSVQPPWQRAFTIVLGGANLILGGLGLAALRGYRVIEAPPPEVPGTDDTPAS